MIYITTAAIGKEWMMNKNIIWKKNWILHTRKRTRMWGGVEVSLTYLAFQHQLMEMFHTSIDSTNTHI